MKNNLNVGACGHAKCAGGVLCYQKGKPMSIPRFFTQEEHIAKHTKEENTYDPECAWCQ